MKSLVLPLTLLAAAGVAAAQVPTNATPVISIQLAGDGSQGGNPYAGFIQASDGNFYGTMQCFGGSAANGDGCYGNYDNTAGGVLFKVTPTGTYSIVHTFTQAEGAVPQGLVQAPDGFIYGTAVYGGANGHGSIYKFNIATGALTVIYSFDNGSDFANPSGSIIYGDDGYLYGTNAQFENSTANGYGSVWRIKTDGTGQYTIFAFGDDSGSQGSPTLFGQNPYDGVEKVGTTLYGVSQNGGTSGYGAVWGINTNGSTPAVPYDFTNGADGANPSNKPHLAANGLLYGTTPQRSQGQAYQGSVYSYGQTGDFKEIITSPNEWYYGGIAIDNNGNLIYNSELDPSTAQQGGALFAATETGSTVNQLYALPTSGTEGTFPSYTPFIDNQGRIWVFPQFGGSSNPVGGLVAFTTTPAEAPPITITPSATSVKAGGSINISWGAHNAFSSNEQVCFATSSPTLGTWSGLQAGKLTNGVFGASGIAVTFNANSTGTYALSITCGGSETAITKITVTPSQVATTTSLTVTPNPVGANQNVTVKATVSHASGTVVPTGSITFYANGQSLATVPVSACGSNVCASLTAAAAYPTGSYTVTAKYSGDSNYLTSTSPGTTVQIKNVSKTALTVTPSSVKVGGQVKLAVTVSATAGGTPTGTVTFSVSGETLFTGTLNGGTYSATVSSAGYPAGTYSVLASYSGDANHAASSATATVKLTN